MHQGNKVPSSLPDFRIWEVERGKLMRADSLSDSSASLKDSRSDKKSATSMLSFGPISPPLLIGECCSVRGSKRRRCTLSFFGDQPLPYLCTCTQRCIFQTRVSGCIVRSHERRTISPYRELYPSSIIVVRCVCHHYMLTNIVHAMVARCSCASFRSFTGITHLHVKPN